MPLSSVSYGQRDDLKALTLALGLEILLLVLIVMAVYAFHFFHAEPEPRPLALLQLADIPPVPKLPEPEPPKKVEKNTPVVKKQVMTPPQPAVPEPEKLAPVQEPSPFATRPPPPAPAPSPSADATASLLEAYLARIRAAVQAALVYPPAAGEMNFTGRTRVEFRLRQGVQTGVRVVVSSGINLFDRAALQAVRDAQYPLPPEKLGDQSRLFQIWVEFRQ